MRKRLLLLLPLLLLTGCNRTSIGDRLYTHTIGLGGSRTLTLYAQTYHEDAGFSGTGRTFTEALLHLEAQEGCRILTGHTELLCLDGSVTLEGCRDLLFSQGLSPSCKVCFVRLNGFFGDEDGSAAAERIRIAERNGLLGATDLASLLGEWSGAGGTALLPTDSAQRMVLLHRDGTGTVLSEDASRGMYWLRLGDGNLRIALTANGEAQEVQLLGSRLHKSVDADGTVEFRLVLRSENSTASLRTALREAVLRQCSAAIEEMQAAHADVIGIEDLLHARRLPFDPASFPAVRVVVEVA